MEFLASQARSETLQAKRVAKLGKQSEQARATHFVLDEGRYAQKSVFTPTSVASLLLFYLPINYCIILRPKADPSVQAFSIVHYYFRKSVV